MIVDCYTHIWESPDQLGKVAAVALRSLVPISARETDRSESVEADAQSHLAAAGPVDKTIVLGFKSHYLGADIPNAYVARYVRQHPDKLIGFAGVDPSRYAEAIDDITMARDELGMKGIRVAPAAQDFHPANTEAMRVYAHADKLNMPIMFDHGMNFSRESKLEYAQPVWLDEIAREFPRLRILIAHMGYPWINETVVLLGKHENVFADISGLLDQPFNAYTALLSAYQQGVIDKLLFGSDFPYTSAASCIESLYSINQFCHGTNLPTIPREQLRSIVECDALARLGIGTAAEPRSKRPSTLVDEDL